MDMRQFLDKLATAGHLSVIEKPVTVEREIGALLYESADRGLLFNNIAGFPGWRVVGQAPANLRQFAVAFDTTPENLLFEYQRRLSLGPTPWRKVETGPVKDVILRGEEADILKLPANQVWSTDGGRYIGAALCVVRDPDTGIHNAAWHRIQLKESRKTGILARTETHLWQIYQKYERRGEPMPIAIVNGHHPLVYLAGALTGDIDMDEFEMAGTLLGAPLPMVRCETADLYVPAESEIVIEGVVPPGIRESEGPFGEFHGYAASAEGLNPIIQVKAITHRRDPIFKAVVNFRREGCDYTVLNKSLTVYERLRTLGGGLQIKNVTVSSDLFTVYVQLSPRYHGDARNALLQALMGPYLHHKVAIAVDDDVDLFNPNDILWSLSTRVNPAKDVFIVDETRGHPMDMTLDLVGNPGEDTWQRIGSKMGIDATKPPSIAAPEQRRQFTYIRPPGAGEVHLKDYLLTE